MKFIKTKKYPFNDFNAISHYPFVFYKSDVNNTITHESIHIEQQFEVLFISLFIIFAFFGFSFWLLASYFVFYFLYFAEYLIRLIYYKDKKKAYRMISFEQEAYENQDSKSYLSYRMNFSFLKYLFKWQQ